MPARQRGSTLRRGKLWGVRYYDEHGQRRYEGGFETKTAAGDWLDEKVKEVLALRRGDLPTFRRREMPALSELVDEYLAQHVCEANTKATLEARLSTPRGAVRSHRTSMGIGRAFARASATFASTVSPCPSSERGEQRSRRARPGTS
jgi:hypothetical protein